MSLYPWNIAAKLSYAGYLVNYYIITIAYESQKTAYTLSNVENLENIIYIFVLSMVIAIPLYLLIESPATNLEKLLFERSTSEKMPNPLNNDDLDKKRLLNEKLLDKS